MREHILAFGELAGEPGLQAAQGTFCPVTFGALGSEALVAPITSLVRAVVRIRNSSALAAVAGRLRSSTMKTGNLHQGNAGWFSTGCSFRTFGKA